MTARSKKITANIISSAINAYKNYDNTAKVAIVIVLLMLAGKKNC